MFHSPRYNDLNALQALIYQDGINGCTKLERSRLVLAWIAAERMKREMRGIPPLKAISVPWPMKKARTRSLPAPTEIEAEEIKPEQTKEEAQTQAPIPEGGL